MVRISKDSQLIEEISGLINNSNISTQELEILSNAKNKLEQKKYTPKVVAELKSNLAPLARNLSLSKDVVFFLYKTFSRIYWPWSTGDVDFSYEIRYKVDYKKSHNLK